MLLYMKDNQVKEGEKGRTCSTNGGEEGCRILVGKPEEKSPFGRPRRTWADNIKMDLGEKG
jgi:hypothetical protein